MSATSSTGIVRHSWFFGAVVLTLLLLSRLPQLLSPNLFLDGDEAIVGLMARHLLAGQGLPTFFYGQAYGLATFEVASVAGMFLLLGPGALGIKLGSLLIFGTGVLALAGAARTWQGERAAWLIALLCIAMPTWSSVSIRGWGINLSAWTFAHICLWLMARQDQKRVRFPERESVLLGLFVALTGLTQPLALLGLTPFLAWFALRSKGLRSSAYAAMGFVILVALFTLLQRGQPSFWSPAIFANLDLLEALRSLPSRLWTSNSGVYRLGEPLPLGGWITVSSALWLLFNFVVVACTVGQVLRRGVHKNVLQLCLVSVVLTIGVSLWINPEYFGFRYLIWPTTYLALLASFGLDRALRSPGKLRRLALATGVGLALTSTASLIAMGQVTSHGYAPNDPPPEAEALQSLVARLHALGIHHVYSTDPMFQWVLMFASKEGTRARWITADDRVPEYPRAVDDALRSGQPVAIVGPAIHRGALLAAAADSKFAESRIESIGPHYVLWPEPSEVELRALGFEIAPENSHPR